MAFCRFFEVDRAGHIVGTQEQECRDDEDILIAASSMLEEGNGRIHGIEAWLGARKILTLVRD